MADFVTQEKVALHVMTNGKTGGVGTGLDALSIDRHGMTGKTNNTISGRGQIFGRDPNGVFRVKLSYAETPGGLNTGTIEFEKSRKIDYLEDRVRDQQRFDLWEFYIPCARLDNPQGWLDGGRLDYRGKMYVTGQNDGDGPVREASGQPVVNSVPVSWEYNITLLPLSISALTPTTDNDTAINAISGLTEAKIEDCNAGYRGAGKHLTVVTDAADASTSANVLGTRDGGSTWSALSTDPFAVGENISDVVERITTGGAFRRVVSRLSTDASAAAEVAYDDFDFGDEFTASWTTVDIGATNGDVVTILEWLFYNRMYAVVGAVGSEGEIWVSTDQGESWTQVLDGTTVINAVVKGYGQDCKDVYIAGATNTIMVEREQSGTFETLVGPSGGGDFTALAISNDGLLFAGNGTSLYVSTNNAKNTGGWTSVKDFGGSYAVKKIFMPEGDSNHIYCVVDDGTEGRLYHSNDAGNSWNLVTAYTNNGYNDGMALEDDPNLFYMVGEVNGSSNGVIHKASPSVSGC